MEDVLRVGFEKGLDGKEVEFGYFAVFDGHGGVEAAQFARDHLLNEIRKSKGFWSDDDEQVLKAIKLAFTNTHKLMWNAHSKFEISAQIECPRLSTKTILNLFRARPDPGC